MSCIRPRESWNACTVTSFQAINSKYGDLNGLFICESFNVTKHKALVRDLDVPIATMHATILSFLSVLIIFRPVLVVCKLFINIFHQNTQLFVCFAFC